MGEGALLQSPGVPGSPVVTVAPGWGFAAVAVLGALVVVAAVFDGALSARSSGRPGGGTGAARPFGEAARLMRQRRRSTMQADSLLWRVGGAGLVVTAALMVAVVPLGRGRSSTWTWASCGSTPWTSWSGPWCG